MITVVAGTNRPESKSRLIAQFYQGLLNQHSEANQLLDLADLPNDFTESALYHNSGKNPLFNQLRQLMDGSEKFVFVLPEYNNSVPGVFKAFIDGLSYPNALAHKKCALVGISDGVAGNALGLSHITDVFHYLGMNVLAQKVRIPFMKKNFVDGRITDDFMMQLIVDQARLLIKF